MDEAIQERAKFTAMVEGTPEDWQIIGDAGSRFIKGLPDRVLDHLRLLEGDYGGYAVDRYTHSLQCATRAYKDGRDEEYVVCALLHDIGDTLCSYNHPDAAAAILSPFVSEENLWMVQQHGIFQGYYFFHQFGMDRDLREQFRGHKWFDRTAEFCEDYDQNSFDPGFENMPLAAFEPMLRRLMEKPRRSVYQSGA